MLLKHWAFMPRQKEETKGKESPVFDSKKTGKTLLTIGTLIRCRLLVLDLAVWCSAKIATGRAITEKVQGVCTFEKGLRF